MKEEAIQKIENKKCEGPVAELQQMIMCWVEADERAAGLIMAENKTVAGAYKAMEDVARKEKNGSHAVIDPPKAMAITMEYYGMAKDDIQKELEGGLMHRIIMAYATRWKPYGAPVEITTNPQPAADIPQEPAKEPEAKGFSLDDFSMEDML
ncbi:hypothetical protein [uncultured Anaerovibrio sp.]|uniref:hypothetical protein n=1 Tax=uncultured Anaerovibrio sp. TaxID=361586 RepID=UPI00260A15D3|nr:hypothetical protein [uncultured Anaerovibrio sp.]